MSGTKIAIVILVVIAVLFVVLVVYGVHRNGDGSNLNAATDKFKSLNKVLAPYAPKLKLSQTSFDLSHLPVGGKLTVTAPPDDQHSYRKATFRPEPANCVAIEYHTADDKGEKLRNQSWPAEGSDPGEANFTITSAGGPIAFTRALPLGSCVVELE